jgi:hypothetical protein
MDGDPRQNMSRQCQDPLTVKVLGCTPTCRMPARGEGFSARLATASSRLRGGQSRPEGSRPTSSQSVSLRMRVHGIKDDCRGRALLSLVNEDQMTVFQDDTIATPFKMHLEDARLVTISV